MAINFTAEQLKAAKAAKSPEELVARAKEQGYDITHEQAGTFLNGKTTELNDEELENVAGGGCGFPDDMGPYWEGAAKADGHPVQCELDGALLAECSDCGANGSYYAVKKVIRANNADLYADVRCYNCGFKIKSLSTIGVEEFY